MGCDARSRIGGAQALDGPREAARGRRAARVARALGRGVGADVRVRLRRLGLLPFFVFLPLVAAAHALGALAARRDQLATFRDSLTGRYVLLPVPGFASAFVLTAWLVVLVLFSPLHRTPFIYFQF